MSESLSPPPNEQIAFQFLIREREGCSAELREAVHVAERFNGETVWEGDVQHYDLEGHATAKRLYASFYEDAHGHGRAMVVLHLPPVDSPPAAVRASIAAEYRREPR